MQPLVQNAMAEEAGYEIRPAIVRLYYSFRVGDRPKNAEKEFPEVCVTPKGCLRTVDALPQIDLRTDRRRQPCRIESRIQERPLCLRSGRSTRANNLKPRRCVSHRAPAPSLRRQPSQFLIQT